MASVFAKLHDPHLVAKFQNLFGVEKRVSVAEFTDDEDDCIEPYQNGKMRFDSTSMLGDNDHLGHSYNLRSRKSADVAYSSSAASKLDGDKDDKDYTVKWPVFYYLFHIGAGLGNEMFYCCFFPYWFWNVDGYVCRRLVLTWCLIMYIGQALKDLIRLPRPRCPPVIRMEKRYELEYGMPSTHAMIGLAFPTAFLYFTLNRYEFSSYGGLIAVGVIWCICVCLSRLYLGMHSVADVLAGLLLASVLMLGIIPALDYIDDFQLKSDYSPVVMLVVTLAAALMYPTLDEWSTCRGDTKLILGLPSWSTCRGDTICTLGVQLGVCWASWMNYKSNYIPHDAVELVGSPPYHIKTPDLEWVGMALIRMLMGYSSLFITRAIMKGLTYKLSCWMLKLNPADYDQNKKLKYVELPYKYLTYAAISINVVYLSPLMFRYFDIERPTAWTEV